jgi:WS/DGAT C-terminal domain
VLITNNRPAGVRIVKTIVRARSQMRRPTVTVGALGAIGDALSGYLFAHGADASLLGAEVPMAKDGVRHAHNHFRNVSIALYPHASTEERARRISADLDDRRRRGAHPAFMASDRALAAVPAPLLHWGVAQFDIDARSELVTGNTVVSSIYRGPADLSFGGCPVILTAGYPALSPMMGLTHGVHGIGDTVAISVHTAESVMADMDDYVDRLDAALTR